MKGNATTSDKRQRTITRVIILTSFCSSFLGSAVNIVVPAMSADLAVSAGAIGWVITVYSLATCGLSVPFGKLADSTGKNRVFLLGLSLLCLSSLACFLVTSFPLMLLFRCLQGVGASMIFATNTAIIVAAHPQEQRGRAIGRMLSGTYVGLACGPVLSGIVSHWFGWHAIFLVVASAVFIALIPAVIHLPWHEDLSLQGPVQPLDKKKKQDAAGCILFIVMITCSMFGFASIGTGWWPYLLILCGIGLGILFVRTELAAADPIIDVRIFRSSPAYTLSNLAALFNYAAIFGIGYFTSLYLQLDKGLDSQTAGLFLICQPLVMALFTSRAGALSDRIAPYKLGTTGMGLCAASLVLFALVSHSTPLWVIVCGLLIAGFGVAVFSSPNMNAIMSCVDKSHYGVASSILATMRTLGQTSGIAITTIVVNARLGALTLQQASTEQFESAMHISFWIFTAICVCGMFMSLKRKDS
ncbi:MAG: MFS transporter [Firmicutes bacterium]|nr:MFS transporter [Bacillota bacterium]